MYTSLNVFVVLLIKVFSVQIKSVFIRSNSVVVNLKKSDIILLTEFLKKNSFSKFKQLLDICVVDHFTAKERFCVLYKLLSLTFTRQLFINILTEAQQPVKSFSGLYESACWLEREAWDLYGVFFAGQKDLRRILTDYGFVGFPLRKDFPLSGFLEVRYSDVLKKIITEPLEVTQEFRLFDFGSPWEFSAEGSGERERERKI